MSKNRTYDKLMELGKRYGVDTNEMWISATEQYCLQKEVIQQMKKTLEEEDSLMASKEYVKGRVNVYANPLVKELPKHTDCANKTLQTMLNIIEKLGSGEKPTSRLEELMNE